MSKYGNKKRKKRWWAAGRAVRQSVPVGCSRQLVEARQDVAGRQSVEEARQAVATGRETGFQKDKDNDNNLSLYFQCNG